MPTPPAPEGCRRVTAEAERGSWRWHEIAVTELLLVATAAKLNATERLDELDELTRSLQPPAE
ncbi:hypothetical protein OG233_18925 [Streptomyces sp. NBC_01218]|uniref:hypothetical protein n=1 Tax=Streptomyces sp. NBC_01218 TaxID=2903780 RepID=UPI002E165A35|nr:hypothetical protein OG233_18925 [Streptomyces sp. NBC_01218]